MVSTRFVMWAVAFMGYSVHYMLLINLNIAIVAMVNRTEKSDETDVSSTFECYNITSTKNDNGMSSDKPGEFKFPWNERQQNIMLGGVYWLNGISHVIGGYAAHHLGAKKVFCFGHFVGSVLSFFMPAAAFFHYRLVLVLRIVQGFFVGSSFPAVNVLASNWIPANERGTFLTCYLGVSIGVAITYPICGYIMHYFNWQGVFYTTGALGILWSIIWVFTIYDTPEEHPRLSGKEYKYIKSQLEPRLCTERPPVPWKSILTSVPVYTNFVAQFGVLWGYLILVMHGPTYFSFIHGFDSRTTGLITGIPNVFRVVFAILFAILTDHLITKKIIKSNTVRKLSVVVCNSVVGVFLIGLAFSGCNHILAVVTMSAAIILHGAAITGTIAGIADMSPNFCAILQGMCGIISSLPGFLAPTLVGYLTFRNQRVEQWQKVFTISAIIIILAGLLFVLFGDSNVQIWDSGESCTKTQYNKSKERNSRKNEVKKNRTT